MDFWYALFVKTGDEDNIKSRIGYCLKDEFMAFVPKREIVERKEGKLNRKVKILFPGYVFLNGVIEDRHMRIMYDVPNLYNVLREGYLPAVIPQDEINVFKHLMTEDIIEISNAIMEGDRVIIVDGPLLSLQGSIIRVDKRKGRAKVAVEFLGQVKMVDLGVNFIAKT